MKAYKKVLSILLKILIITIIILLCIFGYNLYNNYSITNDAEDFVDDFDSILANASDDNNDSSDESDGGSSSSSTGTSKLTYKGYEVIGTIEIPKTNAKYPILNELTVKSLNTSVVAIYPENPTVNTVGNIVIIGHNKRNGTFFSNNKKLSTGDKIYITDLNDNKVTYYIYKIFTTDEDDTSFYDRDTDGKMEITLSSCTDDSKQRIIILASNEE